MLYLGVEQSSSIYDHPHTFSTLRQLTIQIKYSFSPKNFLPIIKCMSWPHDSRYYRRAALNCKHINLRCYNFLMQLYVIQIEPELLLLDIYVLLALDTLFWRTTKRGKQNILSLQSPFLSERHILCNFGVLVPLQAASADQMTAIHQDRHLLFPIFSLTILTLT